MATETVANDAVFINLAIAFFCLVANGFYVAAEFAIVKCKPLRIDQLANENAFAGKLARHILNFQDADDNRRLPHLHCKGLGREHGRRPRLKWCERDE